MYTEEYESRGFPLGFLGKVIIVLLLVIGVFFLIVKFVVGTNTMKENKKKPVGETEALLSQIFINNLERLKKVAIDYYSVSNLPKEDKESYIVTLKELIDKKLIVALIDRNNKFCDVEKSYAKITKEGENYILKVNLKDSEKEEYIIVNLNYYKK